MSYISKDEHLLGKIKKHVNVLQRGYSNIKDLNTKQLEDSLEAYACIQCITNIYGLYGQLENDDVIEKLSFINSKHIRKLRNIGAHDYDSINWEIAKEVSGELIKQVSDAVIEECISIVRDECSRIKDYTSLYNTSEKKS